VRSLKGRPNSRGWACMVELQGIHEHVITNFVATKGLYRCVFHKNMLKLLFQTHLHHDLCVHNINVHMKVYIVSSDNLKVYASPCLRASSLCIMCNSKSKLDCGCFLVEYIV
jgi:hypothetical protein